MAFSVGSPSGESDVMLDVNTTPLIDVMLVLLVMLIITIPIQTHAIKLDMPRPNDNPQEEKDKPPVVVISVDFDHTIYWNGGSVTKAQLDSNFFYEGQKVVEDQAEIHILPNQNAIYGDVAMVMANAQRRGVKKIAIIGTEQFPQYFQ
ncbi:MAG: biopolymer transporter ExbD [Gemmataceae bacterium]